MPTSRHATASCFAIGLTCLFVACGTTDDDPQPSDGDAGSGTAATHSGANGTGGSAAGKAGMSTGATASAGANMGPGGNASAGSSAAAGEPGTSGGVGSAGAPSGSPECEIDDDCAVVNDCCACGVAPVSNKPPECEKLCIQSACDARGIQAGAVCRSKRCVFDLSCDRSSVTCKAAEPECEAGQVPSVIDTCWGPCIDVAQCRDVTDCTACAAGQVCVQNQDSLGFTQCVEVDPVCAESPSCACTDACNFSCSDDDGIACFCIVC